MRHRLGDECEWTCPYCDQAMICPNCVPDSPRHAQATFDHVYPKSAGGPSTLDNLVLCCEKCNVEKSDKILTASEIFRPASLTVNIGTLLSPMMERWTGGEMS